MMRLRDIWICAPDGVKQFLTILAIGLPVAAIVVPLVFGVITMIGG